MDTREWQDRLLEVTADFSRGALGFVSFEPGVILKTVPGNREILKEYISLKQNMVGVYMPFIDEHETVLVGIFTERASSRELAQAFLKPEPGAEALSTEDIADTFKEILNVLTGMMKERDKTHVITGARGLPIYVDGFIQLTPDQQSSSVLLKLGDLKMHLIVIHSSPAAVPTKVFPRPPLSAVSPEECEKHIQDWVGQTMTATLIFTQKVLGLDDCRLKTITGAISKDAIYGAYMPLLVDQDGVLIGLLSNNQGFEALSRSFLRLGEDDQRFTAEDTPDTVKEILNIISGIIKDQMFGHHRIFRRGMPIFIDGYIELTEGQESSCLLIELKQFKIYMVVIRKAETVRPAQV